MHTVIGTIGDTIFQLKETLKNQKEERDELLDKLCSKQQAISNVKYKIDKLETELKSLHQLQYGAKMGGQDTCAETNLSSVSRGPASDKNLRKNED